jgi:hypothetical protein
MHNHIFALTHAMHLPGGGEGLSLFQWRVVPANINPPTTSVSSPAINSRQKAQDLYIDKNSTRLINQEADVAYLLKKLVKYPHAAGTASESAGTHGYSTNLSKLDTITAHSESGERNADYMDEDDSLNIQLPWRLSACPPRKLSTGANPFEVSDGSQLRRELVLEYAYGMSAAETRGTLLYLANGDVVYPAACVCVVSSCVDVSVRGDGDESANVRTTVNMSNRAVRADGDARSTGNVSSRSGYALASKLEGSVMSGFGAIQSKHGGKGLASNNTITRNIGIFSESSGSNNNNNNHNNNASFSSAKPSVTTTTKSAGKGAQKTRVNTQRHFTGHMHAVTAMCMHDNGVIVASGDAAGGVCIWECAQSAPIKLLIQSGSCLVEGEGVTCMCFAAAAPDLDDDDDDDDVHAGLKRKHNKGRSSSSSSSGYGSERSSSSCHGIKAWAGSNSDKRNTNKRADASKNVKRTQSAHVLVCGTSLGSIYVLMWSSILRVIARARADLRPILAVRANPSGGDVVTCGVGGVIFWSVPSGGVLSDELEGGVLEEGTLFGIEGSVGREFESWAQENGCVVGVGREAQEFAMEMLRLPACEFRVFVCMCVCYCASVYVCLHMRMYVMACKNACTYLCIDMPRSFIPTHVHMHMHLHM